MELQEELIKQVFAQFGAAYYQSEVLHRGLCVVCALATFGEAGDVTRPRVEEKLGLAFSLTLGQVIEKTKNLFPNDLQQHLEVALDRRNYLAHRFWYERNFLMFSDQGLLKLRQELLELNFLFTELDETVRAWFRPKRQAMGISDELMQEMFDRLAAGEPDESLPSQRRPRKQERIVRAWDVKVGDNLITQILQTEDGCLWQLCDVGLGWTRFEKPAPDWKVNEAIQKYLPAIIKSRPPAAEPWNYEFNLAKGAVLWVKRGKRERSYTWGVKAPS